MAKNRKNQKDVEKTLSTTIFHKVEEYLAAYIKQLVENKQNPVVERRLPIGIDAAYQIIGKAKPTIYALIKKRLLPCYKNGKKLYFFEDELIDWIGKGKKKTLAEINDEVEASYQTKSKSGRR
jgi:predicted DNA-binding transcriptional regulator AlpA